MCFKKIRVENTAFKTKKTIVNEYTLCYMRLLKFTTLSKLKIVKNRRNIVKINLKQ